jgi:uncharacterized membrane protein YagU involved in acid resistance
MNEVTDRMSETERRKDGAGRPKLSVDSFKDGLAAGFAGTLAMSMVMLLNDRHEYIPQVHLLRDLTHMIEALTGIGLPLPLAFLIHLVLGSFVFGCAFAAMFGGCAGSFVVYGLLFGLALWIGVMSIVCPILGQGFFALRLGARMIPAASLLFIHELYGWVLGAAFGSMQARRSRSK